MCHTRSGGGVPTAPRYRPIFAAGTFPVGWRQNGSSQPLAGSTGFRAGASPACHTDAVPELRSQSPVGRPAAPPRVMGGQWHLDPDSYLHMVRSEVPSYDRLQAILADATVGGSVRTILDLGSGTGVTAEHVLRVHPGAALVGIDSSEEMLMHARRLLPGATFLVSHLEDPLPNGPFDRIVSALAIHHLDDRAKANLFHRVSSALHPGGRFAFLDVVVPTAPVAKLVPIEPDVDLPSPVDDLLDWLREANLDPVVLLAEGDLAVITAGRPA